MKKEEAIDWIREAVKEINKQIFNHQKEHPESSGMGTTLVTTAITKVVPIPVVSV